MVNNLMNKYILMHETITSFKDGACPYCKSKNIDEKANLCKDCNESVNESPDYVRYIEEIGKLKALFSACEWEVS